MSHPCPFVSCPFWGGCPIRRDNRIGFVSTEFLVSRPTPSMTDSSLCKDCFFHNQSSFVVLFGFVFELPVLALSGLFAPCWRVKALEVLQRRGDTASPPGVGLQRIRQSCIRRPPFPVLLPSPESFSPLLFCFGACNVLVVVIDRLVTRHPILSGHLAGGM